MHIPINTSILVIRREIIKNPGGSFFLPWRPESVINQLNPVYPQLGFLVPAHFSCHLLLVQNLLPLGGKQLLIGSSSPGCTSPLSFPAGAESGNGAACPGKLRSHCLYFHFVGRLQLRVSAFGLQCAGPGVLVSCQACGPWMSFPTQQRQATTVNNCWTVPLLPCVSTVLVLL